MTAPSSPRATAWAACPSSSARTMTATASPSSPSPTRSSATRIATSSARARSCASRQRASRRSRRPGDQMKICAFLWVYYGYPNSNYEGVNVEAMRYRNGAIMARDEEARDGQMPDVDYVAGVPDSGLPHAIGYATETQQALRPPLHQVHPHLAALLHAEQPGGPQPRGEDEADPRAGAHQGQEAPVRGRLHRARHPACARRSNSSTAPARRKCTCAPPARPSCTAAST